MSTTEAQLDDLLHRGVAQVIDEKSLRVKLRRRKPLRVKLGIDPTSHHLHLGHVVPLRKLRAWQEAGHQAVLIIGDYTAQVGDPSGRDKARIALSREQTRRFAETYLEQIGSILDVRRAEVRYNSEWYDRFSVHDMVKLLSQASVNQLLAHETFKKRLDQKESLGLQELIYPLLQGYDSVAIEADVELGGIDQTFNLLTGRDVQQWYGVDRQDVMTLEYLLGTDGKMKMSKTADNTINLSDSAADMFGKTMSIPDKLIVHYYELCTDVPATVIGDVKNALKKKTTNPRDLKISLAKEIVRQYHGQAAADDSAMEFTRVFRNKKAPTGMPTIELKAGPHQLLNLLVSQRLAASRSEARRLIEQGGVKIDQQTIKDWEVSVNIEEGTVIQIGKRRFVKVKIA